MRHTYLLNCNSNVFLEINRIRNMESVHSTHWRTISEIETQSGETDDPLWIVCFFYNRNVSPALAFLLDSFHPAFYYERIVCSETTCVMEPVCYFFSPVYRHKSLLFHSCTIITSLLPVQHISYILKQL